MRFSPLKQPGSNAFPPATLVEAIEAAKHLGIPILNMHLLEGVYFTLPDKKHYLYDSHRNLFFGRLVKAIARAPAPSGK